MDPTTILPPPPPQLPPPENCHTPPDTTTDDNSGEPISSRNLENLKSLALNIARRLPPAQQSLIKQHIHDILPNELLIPDHPPYSDMILTAMWELNRDGASSEEAISDFIKKEYHELPWAHSTILSHHLRDLQIKDKITMTNDNCYVRCPLITKPIVRPSSRCPSPMSSSYSSSSASLCSSPSSSSTSFCSDSPRQTHKRKRKRRRRNMKGRGGTRVHVRGRGRGSGRGRGRPPLMNRVGQRGSSLESIRGRKRGRLGKEVKITEESRIEEEQMDVDDVDEPIRETEDPNEVRNAKVEEDAICNDEHGQNDEAEKQENQPQNKNDDVESVILVEDQTESIASQKVCEEWVGNVHEKEESVVLRRSRRNKIVVSDEENVPQKHYKVTWIGRGVHRLKQNRRDLLEDDESEEENVGMIDSDGEVDENVEHLEENVEHLEEKDEKLATTVECNQPEDNGQSDIVEKQVFGEERLMNVVERHNDDTEEQIMKTNKEENKTCEQEKSIGTDKNTLETETVVKTEAKMQNDNMTEKLVDKTEQSEELHDDGVTEKPIHPQENSVEKTEDSLQSCEQSQPKNGDPKSTEKQPQPEEQQTERNQREPVIAVTRIKQIEISEKDALQDKNNDNSASSCSTNSLDHKHQDEPKRQLRQGLRSSSKKQEPTPKSKKQVEPVTLVHRSLRSREIISEAAVITEKVPDHSKEQIKPPGRPGSSRREPKIAEAEQVTTSRKTRSSGL